MGGFLDRWLNDPTKNRALKTTEGYECIIEYHLKPHLGNILLNRLRPANLQEFYENCCLKAGKIRAPKSS
ncbi:hypothetical protein [Pelotomaculum terephthalicicum]|uniref:hypothetical protein n=1 Tax=Pelotomaculum terephthalicicum TaxID=206393 RepID=UPI0035E3E96D